MAKKKSAENTSEDSPLSFEEALAQVSEIVDHLEDGTLTLAQSLEAYAAGVKHLKTCHAALDDAERKIELLSGFTADGTPITEPFDDTATAAQDQVGKRSRDSKKTPSEKPDSESLDETRELF
jgi:exodeoxyribonuclease VII small subunit